MEDAVGLGQEVGDPAGAQIAHLVVRGDPLDLASFLESGPPLFEQDVAVVEAVADRLAFRAGARSVGQVVRAADAVDPGRGPAAREAGTGRRDSSRHARNLAAGTDGSDGFRRFPARPFRGSIVVATAPAW